MAEQKQNGTVATVEQQPVSMLQLMEREFEALRHRMWEGFGRPFPRLYGPSPLTEPVWAPRVDAYEKDGILVIKAELPGVKQGDITVTTEGGYLTIAAHRAEEKEAKDARYYASERYAGSMRRSFALPEGMDTSAITAEFKDGVLEVRAPLPKPAGPSTIQIPIKG
jgi:HSP20 family protein